MVPCRKGHFSPFSSILVGMFKMDLIFLPRENVVLLTGLIIEGIFQQCELVTVGDCPLLSFIFFEDSLI